MPPCSCLSWWYNAAVWCVTLCRNQTPLHLAAASGSAAGGGHPEIIKALLASGARVKQPDSGQQTALHKAVLAGSRGDVAALLEGGADPNHVDNMGHSPVHVAAKRTCRSAYVFSAKEVIFSLCLLVCLLAGLRRNYSTDFTQKSIDFGW